MRKIRFYFSLFAAKTLYVFLKLTKLSSGSSIIGKIVLALCPDFLSYCNGYIKTKINVTGTNGKTTTVTMIDEVLRAAGRNSRACGNIGLPISSITDELGYDDIAVMEVSSFQLETLSSICPHIAVVTNIAEDHLNRHYNMENYVFLKAKLLRNMRESEYAVLNYDDPVVKGFAADARCKIRYFSVSERVEGAYGFPGVTQDGQWRLRRIAFLCLGRPEKSESRNRQYVAC